MRWAGHVTGMRKINSYSILVEKPEEKRPLRRPRHRCEDNVRRDLRETGCVGVNWVQPAQDSGHWYALVNAVMNL